MIQHSLPNDELCHDTSDSESVPQNGQVQLRTHARATFASGLLKHRPGSIGCPFAMLYHIELASISGSISDQEYQIDDM